jgi:transposase
MTIFSALFPSSWRVKNSSYNDREFFMELISKQERSQCPMCGTPSSRIHSHYSRFIRDLPIAGYTVHLSLLVRKFFCDSLTCQRRVFTERFSSFLVPYARKTSRLKEHLIKIAYSMSAEQGGKLTSCLGMCVSASTLLRFIRQTKISLQKSVRVAAIDDWAFTKGKRYGTLICDAESHRPLELLPDRTVDTVKGWLHKHPEIHIVTRDGSHAYAKAIKDGAPQAIQISDRWHLLRNLSVKVDDFLKRTCKKKRLPLTVIKKENEKKPSVSTDENPKTETKALTEQQKEKWKLILQVQEMRQKGLSILFISKQIKRDPKTIRKYLELKEPPIRQRRRRESILTPYKSKIQHLLYEGKTIAEIFEAVKQEGYPGSTTILSDYIASFRRNIKQEIVSSLPKKYISLFQMAYYIWEFPDKLTKEQNEERKQAFQCFPFFEPFYTLIQRYRKIIQNQQHDKLHQWIAEAQKSNIPEIHQLVNGIQRDYLAISHALQYPWTNGLIEGHVNRLKTLKRLMYGRANFDLLRQRVLYKF